MEFIIHYSNLLKIKEEVKLSFHSGKGYNGYYYNTKHKIVLNDTIFNTWDKDRRAWEFLIAHELVHAKYKDLSVDGLYGVFIPKIALKNAFKEMRANTIAYKLTNFTPVELASYFKEIYAYPESVSGITGGYLRGEEYTNFILQHPEWNEETIEAAGRYFRNYGHRWNYFRLVFERNYMKVKEGYLLALDFS